MAGKLYSGFRVEGNHYVGGRPTIGLHGPRRHFLLAAYKMLGDTVSISALT